MKPFNEALVFLVGEQLSAVTFGQGCVQAHFDGHLLTLFVAIEVTAKGGRWSSGDPDFRNQLCNLIGKIVVGTECSPESLGIGFADGDAIRISLRDDAYVGPEALTFQLRDDSRLWVA